MLLAHRCCVGLAAGLCARRGGWTWTRWRPSPVLPKKCCRSRDGSYAYVCSRGGSWVNTTLCRTHGLKSGACRRPETERQGLPMRPSHDSVRRSESSLHTVGPPVLLNSIIGTPGGRYMRLVTPLRAPFAPQIAPSHRGGLVQHLPPRQTPPKACGGAASLRCGSIMLCVRRRRWHEEAFGHAHQCLSRVFFTGFVENSFQAILASHSSPPGFAPVKSP